MFGPLQARLIQVGVWFHFLIRSVFALPRVLLHPRDWLAPLYMVLVGGLPLAAVTGASLGIVLWIHTRGVLARTITGAADYLPTFLAAAVLLELAPIAAGLIVAARTGASLGAGLASMRQTEQVDALELLGISPIRRLVAPRVLACVIGTPALYVVIATLAIAGGYLAEVVTAQTTVLKYTAAVERELRVETIVPAALKTLVFGALIGVTGCFIGMNARGGSEEVGHAATTSVVTCSLLVLAADVLLVGWIQVLFG